MIIHWLPDIDDYRNLSMEAVEFACGLRGHLGPSAPCLWTSLTTWEITCAGCRAVLVTSRLERPFMQNAQDSRV